MKLVWQDMLDPKIAAVGLATALQRATFEDRRPSNEEQVKPQGRHGEQQICVCMGWGGGGGGSNCKSGM